MLMYAYLRLSIFQMPFTIPTAKTVRSVVLAGARAAFLSPRLVLLLCLG